MKHTRASHQMLLDIVRYAMLLEVFMANEPLSFTQLIEGSKQHLSGVMHLLDKEKHIFKNTAYNLPKTGFSRGLVEREDAPDRMRSLFVATDDLKSYKWKDLSDKIAELEYQISKETGTFVLNPVGSFHIGIQPKLKDDFRKKKELLLEQLKELNDISVEILRQHPLELMGDHELLGEVKLIMELGNHCGIKNTDHF